MSTAPPPPPAWTPASAGWYDDPFHRFELRYHDGTEWTHHVSDGSGTSFVDPSGTSPFVQGPVPGPPPPGAVRRDLVPVSFGLRFAAWLLDNLIIGVPLAIALFVTVDWDAIDSGDVLEIPAWYYLAVSALGLAYHTLMVGRWGRTVGKMATGITVVRASDGSAPGYDVAGVRALVLLLNNIPYLSLGAVVLIVSVIMMFSSPRRQALHDRAAGTMVVRRAS